MFRLLQSLIGSQGGRVPLAGQGRSPCRRQAKPPHEVRILRAEHGYSARRRAVKTFKSAKGVWGKTRVFPHKQHIKSSHDYPPKQSGGLFRKNITHLNYSFPQQHNKPKFSVSLRDPDPISHKNKAAFRQP